MSFWMLNELTISGPKDQILGLASRCGDEENSFSFTDFLPIPNELIAGCKNGILAATYVWTEQTNNKGVPPMALLKAVSDSGQYWNFAVADAKTLYKSLPDEETSTRQVTKAMFVEEGHRALANLIRHGVMDWHGWCLANWGTARDAHACKLGKPDVDDEQGTATLQLSFRSEFFIPQPVLMEICQQYPEVVITGTCDGMPIKVNSTSFCVGNVANECT